MFVSTIAFAGLSYTKPPSHRLFHYITAGITMVAAIAYFTMGADLGETGITVEFVRTNSKVSGTIREIFYVRYIDWYVRPVRWSMGFRADWCNPGLSQRLYSSWIFC